MSELRFFFRSCPSGYLRPNYLTRFKLICPNIIVKFGPVCPKLHMNFRPEFSNHTAENTVLEKKDHSIFLIPNNILLDFLRRNLVMEEEEG